MQIHRILVTTTDLREHQRLPSFKALATPERCQHDVYCVYVYTYLCVHTSVSLSLSLSLSLSIGGPITAEFQSLAGFATRGTTAFEDLHHCAAAHAMAPKWSDAGAGIVPQGRCAEFGGIPLPVACDLYFDVVYPSIYLSIYLPTSLSLCLRDCLSLHYLKMELMLSNLGSLKLDFTSRLNCQGPVSKLLDCTEHAARECPIEP